MLSISHASHGRGHVKWKQKEEWIYKYNELIPEERNSIELAGVDQLSRCDINVYAMGTYDMLDNYAGFPGAVFEAEMKLEMKEEKKT